MAFSSPVVRFRDDSQTLVFTILRLLSIVDGVLDIALQADFLGQ